MGNNGRCLFSCINLGDNDSTALIVSVALVKLLVQAHCAPASNALLIRSECAPPKRTSGETPIDAIAATALCMESSLIYPCSQSMIIP